MEKDISPTNRTVAKAAADALGGSPTYRRYWDAANVSYVDIMTSADCPQRNVNSYATIGLADHPLYLDGEIYPARTELVGACAKTFDLFPNVLASAAFNVINSKMFCAPEVIFGGVFAAYRPKSPLKHIMFFPPFLWEDTLQTLHIAEDPIAWLLVVPITDAERKYAKRKGGEALEDLFVQKQIDIFNPDRPSIV